MFSPVIEQHGVSGFVLWKHVESDHWFANNIKLTVIIVVVVVVCLLLFCLRFYL